MPTFQLELQFDEKGAATAVRQLGKVADAAGKAQQAVDRATASGLTWDATVKRWRNASGAFASTAEKAAAGIKGVGTASQNAAKEIEKANAAAYKFGHTLGSSIREGGGKLRSLTTKILALVGAYKALQGVSSYFSRIFDFSSNIENSQIAIASVVSATNKISDAQGRTLEGAEKFNAAQEISAQLMDEIQTQALQSTATFDSLVEGVSGIIAPATKAGVSLEKLPKFAVTAAQAMAAMKIPVQQMRTEIEALLSGNISRTQDILATNLGITGEMVKNWQKQGTLVEELERRLSTFAEAGEATAQTWTGLKSNLEDVFDYLSSKTGKGVFEGAKQSYRELLDLMLSTEGGKLGVGKDIENIVKMIEDLQEEIGQGLLGLTQDLIEKIKELNQPENIAEIKKSFDEFKDTAKEVLSALGSVTEVIGSFISTSVEGWRSMPDIIQELGLVGAIAFGAKGRIALLGLGAAYQGLKEIFDLASSGDGGADAYKAYWAMQHGLNSATSAVSQGAEAGRNIVGIASSTISQGAKSGRGEYQIASSIGGFADSGKGASQIASAQEHIKKLREEIDRLNGTSVKAVTSLDQKLREIETVGKKAGMSADAIKQLQGEYQTAFKSNALENFNKELLQAQGNTKALRQIEIGDAIKGWEQQFKAAGVSAAEAQPKIEALRAALEKKQEYQDLQTAVGFYDELSQLSGDYTRSLEKQNELISLKAEIYRQNRIPPELVAEWELLQKIEKARDPWSGLDRSVRKFYASATDYARGFEEVSTQALTGFSSTLTSVLWKGEQDFGQFFQSIGQMITELAIQASMAQIIGGGSGGGGLMGLLGGLFGSGGGGGLDSISGGGGWGWLPSAHGNVFSAPGLSAHSNTVVDEPTFFGYDRHFTAFASGAGLMGEAGPEAVMPLSRMSGGDLGVKVMWPDDMMRRVVEMDAWKANVGASQEMMQAIAKMNEMRAERAAAMAGAPKVNVTIINQAGAEVETSQQPNSDGGIDLKIMMLKEVARDTARRGGYNNKVLRNQFGASKRPIKY